MIDASLRLRRAIHTSSLTLTQRILRTHPHLLRNPDTSPTGLSNTSLHLAASLGFTPIVTLLLSLHHETADSISLNEDHQTALMLAAREGHTDVVLALCQSGLGEVGRQDVRGRDAVMFACERGHDTVLQILLTYAPAPAPPTKISRNRFASRPPMSRNVSSSMTVTTLSANSNLNHGGLPNAPHQDLEADPAHSPAVLTLLSHADIDGNTALHFASSNGHLLVLRTLLAAGADAERKNVWSWTPVAYSATVAAEVYFKGLIAEVERRKKVRTDVLRRGAGGAVRVVGESG